MDKKDWNEAKRKLKEAFDKGMIYLKEGARDANYVKNKAVAAVRLEMNLLKLKNRLDKEYQKIGKQVVRRIARSKIVKFTDDVKKGALGVVALEKEVAKIDDALRHFTVTRKTR